MKYIVMEIQTTDQVATIVNAYDTLNEAKSRYHAILSAAAVSDIPMHSAVILDQTGMCLQSEYFEHVTMTETEAE